MESCTTPVMLRKSNMSILNTVSVRSNTSAAHQMESITEKTLTTGTRAM